MIEIDILYKNITLLIVSAIEERPVSIEIDNAEELLSLAEKHNIANIVYYGLKNSNIKLSPDLEEKFENYAYKSVFKDKRQLYELNRIYTAFDLAGIYYMPVKGAVLKYLYPKTDMRNMSDADILIKTEQYETIKQVMQSLGYKEKLESNHELIWHKEKSLNLELHKMLIPSYNSDYYGYFGDGWKLARPVKEGEVRHTLSDEDHYIYVLTHFAKHYRDGGIGINHLLDIFILNKLPLDRNYIENELKSLNLYEFYCNVQNAISVCFEDGNEDEISAQIIDYVFNSGVYGTVKNHQLSRTLRQTKENSTDIKTVKSKKIISAFFPSYEGMCIMYPSLKHCPVLLPFYWVFRIFHKFIFEKSRISAQKTRMKNITKENVREFENSLEKVGLKFNLKE